MLIIVSVVVLPVSTPLESRVIVVIVLSVSTPSGNELCWDYHVTDPSGVIVSTKL